MSGYSMYPVKDDISFLHVTQSTLFNVHQRWYQPLLCALLYYTVMNYKALRKLELHNSVLQIAELHSTIDTWTTHYFRYMNHTVLQIHELHITTETWTLGYYRYHTYTLLNISETQIFKHFFSSLLSLQRWKNVQACKQCLYKFFHSGGNSVTNSTLFCRKSNLCCDFHFFRGYLWLLIK